MTHHAVPYTKSELAADLRALGARDIASKADLKGWYSFANRVAAKLRSSSAEVLGNVPELVWHYLSDADIRFKDERYREMQEEEIAKVIEALLQG